MNPQFTRHCSWSFGGFSLGVAQNRIGAKTFSEIKLTVAFYPQGHRRTSTAIQE